MVGKALSILAIGLAAIATLCLIFLWKGIMVSRTQTPPIESETFSNDVKAREDADIPVLPSMTREFTFEPANISFTLPDGWEHLALVDAPQLVGFNTSQFALTNDTAGCFLVYYDQMIDRDIYAQTGFGLRTFAGDQQFDNQWYAPHEVLPEDFTFDYDKPQRFPREIYTLGISFNTPTYKVQPQLILFERDGKVIPDACINDMKSLTESWKRYFKTTTLDLKSAGHIYVQREPSSSADVVAHLFFKPDDGSPAQMLTQSPAAWGRSMTFRADGTIEGVTSRGTLSRFNVFSGATSNSPQLISKGEILDYYHYGEKEWVLSAGDRYCLDKGNCLSTLNLKDTDGQFKAATGGKMQGPTHIVGYVPEKKQLILGSGYGDGGCSHQELYVYDEGKKTLTKSFAYGGCADEPQTPEQVKSRLQYEALVEAAGKSRKSQLLRVERGILSVGDSELVREAGSGTMFIEDYSL